MRFKYTIYPEAWEKLKSLNLLERVKEEKSKEDFPYFYSHLMESDVISMFEDMKERGFFKTFPKEEKFLKKLNEVFQNIESNPWKIKRRGETLEEKTELEDISLMLGYPSSFILTPNEIWNYKEFGFDSMSAFTGTVGAIIFEASHSRDFFNRGYKWNSKDTEGREWKNEVTGDSNYDLKIYKTDITPDKTFDSLGNEVQYRPEIDDDRRIVSAYHSTEVPLLVSLIKYVEQTGLESNVLKEGGKELVELTFSQNQKGGATTEHLFPNERHMVLDFMSFDIPIPVLDKDYRTEQRTSDIVGMAYNEAIYGIYIGPNKEIVFSFEKDWQEPQKNASAVFQPQETDHLIAGLFYQAINGLGRTPARQLAQALNYRYSGEYEKDLERFKINVRKLTSSTKTLPWF